jgi:histidine triad (HIT) family protein
MSHDPDCVFCKIVKGELPCFKLLETDLAIAFMDINPFNDGHCLVVTKAHYTDLFEARQDDLIAVAKTVPRLAAAVRTALQPAGLNIIQANGPAAGQSVFHYHCHVFPRRQGDEARLNWTQTPGDMARIEGNYNKILAALEAG